MYSLFEEELRHEEAVLTRFMIHQEIGHAEADSFLPFHDEYQRGQSQYLEQLAALKSSLSIPVIASLNGISMDGWVEHGKALQEAGADALELNVYYVAAHPSQSAEEVQGRYVALLSELRVTPRWPISRAGSASSGPPIRPPTSVPITSGHWDSYTPASGVRR